MAALEWLVQPLGRLVTLSLLHFLWQGLAICVALAAVIELFNIRRTTVRYACSLMALLAMVICPPATIVWLAQSNSIRLATAPAEFFIERLPVDAWSGSRWLETMQPVLLATWLLGVVVFGSRLILGAVGISRLRRSRQPLPSRMTAIVERIGKRLRIEAESLVFVSKQVTDAMAVGLLRPLVLVPAAWATEMPLDMLEAVIAHELAHLARRDLWVNLLQRIVETLLFYHPAVWWLSRRLRIERELCADELAVAVTGNRAAYAQALEHIANLRASDIRPALAAFLRGETDMRLLQRVRNILGQPRAEQSRLWPAGIVALALPLGLWAAAAFSGVAIADDDDERKKPTIKRERGDSEVETRVTLRKKVPGGDEQREEVIEERVIKRDGKPIVEMQLGRKDLRDEPSDRRVEELTVLVNRLAAHVERLQDQVSQLRGVGDSEKREREREEGDARERKRDAEVRLRRRDEEQRKRATEQDREKDVDVRQHAEKQETVQRALAEKQKVIAELAAKKAAEATERVKKELPQKLEVEVKEKAARAAREKAEAAREKVEEIQKVLEEKFRKLKADGDLDSQDLETIKRKLLDGDKKPVIKARKEPQ